jgi:chromosome segregation ATPase
MQKTALFTLMFWAASARCQTPAKEPDTLRALLAEVHRLRQDIEGMTVAAQRVQIALYALQMQDAAVARSAQRLDGTRSKCVGAEDNRQHLVADIQRLESSLASGTVEQNEAAAGKQRLSELKTHLDAQTAEVQACQAGEAEASTQLRNDQAKLFELQDRIARLDKALEQFGSTAK